MAIDYSALLTEDQKKSILEQRLAQFAAEAYQHEINKTVAAATDNADGVKAAEDALAILDKAIEIHKVELDALA